MAKSFLPVLLNQGLDKVTPSVLTKEGALSECLNYEMTGDMGYKRIDGYERFDGYPNGSWAGVFYHVTLSPVNPGTADLITVGSNLARPAETTSGAEIVGNLTNNFYGNQVGHVVEKINSTNYVYLAYDEGGALKNGEVILFSSAGVEYEANVTSNANPVRNTITDPGVYLQTIRGYMQVMRNATKGTVSHIAGCWWHDDSLYLAIDAPTITFVADDVGNIIVPGTLVKFGLSVYRVLAQVNFDQGDAPVPGEQKVAVLPLNPDWIHAETNNGLTEADSAGENKSVISSATAYMSLTNGEYAYVARCNNPDNSNKRGFTYLTPAYRFSFDAGSYTSEVLPVTGWTLRTATGTKTINVHVDATSVTSGTFAAGTAVGTVVVTNMSGETGGSSIKNDWELWHGGVRRMTLNISSIASIGPKLAGTKRLRIAGTHYQTINANFYGNAGWNRTYGATGASHAFFADESSFGAVYVVDNEDIDQPKYVAYHAGRLALGYAVGSVLRSVVGEPLNWSGVDGADEIATGDRITGLLEVTGDTLVVFGRSSIRKLSAVGAQTTLNSDAGAFDYTAVMIGQEIMYTGVSGISTLSQTAAYGDFEGQRASGTIQQWLRPRLLVDNNGFETGGVAMAIPCRNKNQYRLFLKNGMVIFLTMTGEGYKATRVNYGQGNDLRVPMAWSSAVADNGKERIHVVWDYTLASRGVRGVVGTLPEQDRVYELDSGWGFDGAVFDHYFDTSHFFLTGAQSSGTIERVRMFGRGYGVSTLKLRAASLQESSDGEFSSRVLDFSLPRNPVLLKDELEEFTTIADHANWGLGIKLRVEGNNTEIEPSHICQVLILHTKTEGAIDV